MHQEEQGPRSLTLYLDVGAESPELVRWNEASDFGFGVAVPSEFASLLLRLLTEGLEANRAAIVEDAATLKARAGKREKKPVASVEKIGAVATKAASADKPKRKSRKRAPAKSEPPEAASA